MREPMKPRTMYLWNDPASNKMLSIILRDLSPLPGGRWKARRVRVTAVNDPVARAERAVVKAAVVWRSAQEEVGRPVELAREGLEAAVDALRAAKRRRP